MIDLHYYLDRRACADGAPAPLKLVICKRGQSAQLKTGISLRPSEWDARRQAVVEHPRKRALNGDLARLRTSVEDWLRPQIYSGALADLTATQIKRLVDEFLNGRASSVLLRDIYDAYASTKTGGTAVVYRTMWRGFEKVCSEAGTIRADSVTRSWASGLADRLRTLYAENTVASILRCLKAAWNAARKAGTVTGEPFNGVSTTPVQTRKRDLTLEQMRALWRMEPRTEREGLALDLFRLSFCLRAMNPADLCTISDEQIYNGRLYYKRQKTGKAYSVKIEPEAAELLARHRNGGRYLRARFPDTNNLLHFSNFQLHGIGRRIGVPDLSMYWARHTLASLLFAQGFGMDTVSAVLGHSLGGARVTSTYVDIRERMVDDAMRAVLDLLEKEN